MSKKYIYGSYVGQTNIGRVRITQEDRILTMTNTRGNVLLVVCDGMGGQNKGDYASELTISTIKSAFLNKRRFWNVADATSWMYKVARLANRAVFNEAQSSEKYKGMGTTLTMVLILNDYYLVGQIGDSRCYEMNNGKLHQMSVDQTYVYYLYKTGQIKKEEINTHPQRHMLMNAVGSFSIPGLELNRYKYHDQTILLCSDGLYNNVQESEIENILNKIDTTEQKVNELISLANLNGGSDNIAVILWEVNKNEH